MIQLFIIITLFLFGSCSDHHPSPNSTWQEVAGRNNNPSLKRYPVYRAKVPVYWEREDSNENASVEDTTKPLTTFIIKDQKDQLDNIRITVHNFPSEQIDERIPVEAQIARWKRQFEILEPTNLYISPQAWGGFSGSMVEAQGIMKGESTAMIGWAMQLATEHYQHLNLRGSAEEQLFFKQMRSDFTIKVVGSPNLIARYRNEIISFARSFELIQEIPSSS